MNIRPASWFPWTIWFIVMLQAVLIMLSGLFEALARASSSPLGLGFTPEFLGIDAVSTNRWGRGREENNFVVLSSVIESYSWVI